MKKLLISVLAIVLSVSVFTPFASAALTKAQQDTLIAYTEKFIADGNAKNLMVYGSPNPNIGLNHNLFLSYCADKNNLYLPSNGPALTFPGNYLVFDCSAFFQLMYKAVFGLRTDYTFCYQYSGGHHVSNWSSGFYFDQYDKVMLGEDIMKVYNLKGEIVDLFDTVLYLKMEEGDTEKIKTSTLASYLNLFQPGDVIVGYNMDNGLGHFMFYGGSGYLYHATSNHTGGYQYGVRKQLVSSVGTPYTDLKVLRLADNILEPDFKGYNVPVDFSKLSVNDSSFDTKAPYFERIDITRNANGEYTIDVRASDEYGSLQPLAFANRPDVLYKSSGYGESGIAGVMLTISGTAPDLYYEYHPTNNPDANTYAFITNEHQNRTFTRVQDAKQMYNEMGWEDISRNRKLKCSTRFAKDENGNYVYDANGERVIEGYNYYQPEADFGTPIVNNSGSTLYYLHAKDAAQNISRPILLLLTDDVCYALQGTGELLTRYIMDYSAHPLSASDITGNGTITDADAKLALNHILGVKRLFSDSAVDANGDGIANVIDVITILKNKGKTTELGQISKKPIAVDGFSE